MSTVALLLQPPSVMLGEAVVWIASYVVRLRLAERYGQGAGRSSVKKMSHGNIVAQGGQAMI